MRKYFIRGLLAILNSRLLNSTPCKYEFVGNVDAFSREDIEYTLQREPTMTLQAYIDSANRFKSCPLRKDGGLTVIEADGSSHEATAMDMHELKLAFTPKEN